MSSKQNVAEVIKESYKYGFFTDIDTEKLEKGINEDVIRLISQKKNEPAFLLEFRLKAYKHWLKIKEPNWANLNYKKIDYQDIRYYAAPKQEVKKSSYSKKKKS